MIIDKATHEKILISWQVLEVNVDLCFIQVDMASYIIKDPYLFLL